VNGCTACAVAWYGGQNLVTLAGGVLREELCHQKSHVDVSCSSPWVFLEDDGRRGFLPLWQSCQAQTDPAGRD